MLSPSKSVLLRVQRRFFAYKYLLEDRIAALPPSHEPWRPLRKEPTHDKDDLNRLDEFGVPTGNYVNLVVNPYDLNDHFRQLYQPKPTGLEMKQADRVFIKPHVQREFRVYDYYRMPKMRVVGRNERYTDRFRTAKEENDYNRRRRYKPESLELWPYPEVLFIGPANAGRLSLINTVLLNEHKAKFPKAEIEYLMVSRGAGCTLGLFFFNVSNKFRIVDTPGYGSTSIEKRSSLVLDYLRDHQRPLRQIFLVIDSCEGVTEEDTLMMHLIEDLGYLFDIVFTKVDLMLPKLFPSFEHHPPKKDLDVRRMNYDLLVQGNKALIEYYEELIHDSRLSKLASVPQIFFNNAVPSKMLRRRFGFREIRYSMLGACGLLRNLN